MAGPRACPTVKILYLVSEDWYFCSHRLVLARAAREAGYHVTVVTRVSHHGDRIRDAGLSVVPFDIRRSHISPVYDMRSLYRLRRIYREIRPDLVHHVAMKPVIYGSMTARLCGVSHVVNALGGLGYVFASNSGRAALLRPFVQTAFRLFAGGTGNYVILQNLEDRKTLIQSAGLKPERIVVIRGAGVNIEAFTPREESPGVPVVALVSRMIREKGIEDFVEAARIIRRDGREARCVLVGAPDPDNPGSLPEEKLKAWQEEGIVEWWGHKEDVTEVWSQAHIGVLPTYYGEGIPKSLLEGCAAGRPMVTTDVPGCREVIEDGSNGFLVPPRHPASLARAIGRLLDDREGRIRMGAEGRRRIEESFSDRQLISETLELYERMFSNGS